MLIKSVAYSRKIRTHLNKKKSINHRQHRSQLGRFVRTLFNSDSFSFYHMKWKRWGGGVVLWGGMITVRDIGLRALVIHTIQQEPIYVHLKKRRKKKDHTPWIENDFSCEEGNFHIHEWNHLLQKTSSFCWWRKIYHRYKRGNLLHLTHGSVRMKIARREIDLGWRFFSPSSSFFYSWRKYG